MADENKTPDLANIRQRIDEIDERIQSLINERAQFAQQVGVSKGDLTAAVDYYRPEREAEVCGRSRNAMRDRYVTKKCCGCFGRSCLPAWPSRNH